MVEIGWKGMKILKSPSLRARAKGEGVAILKPGLLRSLRSLAMTVVIVVCFGYSVPLYACPMCTELIDIGRDAAKAWGFGKGIAWSILLMLSMPMLLVAGVALLILRSKRQTLKPERGDDKRP